MSSLELDVNNAKLGAAVAKRNEKSVKIPDAEIDALVAEWEGSAA